MPTPIIILAGMGLICLFGSNMTNSIFIWLIFLLLIVFVYVWNIQTHEQDIRYEELRSYIDSHNSRLNALEQRPELVIEEIKE